MLPLYFPYTLSLNIYLVSSKTSFLLKMQNGRLTRHRLICLNQWPCCSQICVKCQSKMSIAFGPTSEKASGNLKSETGRQMSNSSCMERISATVLKDCHLCAVYHVLKLCVAAIYPPHNYCMNTGICDRANKGRKLQKVDQTRGVLYTLDGVFPVWVIRFQCEGNSFLSKYSA